MTSEILFSGRKAQENEPIPAVEYVITDSDIGPDFDDLLRAILARVLQNDGLLQPILTITSTGDVESRAYLEAYVQRMMGIVDVPVVPGEVAGRGTDEVKDHERVQFAMARAEADKEAFQVIQHDIVQAVIEKISSLPDKSVTFLVTSTSSTLKTLLENSETRALIQKKFKKVVFMGTAEISPIPFDFEMVEMPEYMADDVPTVPGIVVPQGRSANFNMDYSAGTYCVQTLQEMGIRTDIVTKNATGQAYLEADFLLSLVDTIPDGAQYDELRRLAHLLYEIPTSGLINLWKRVNVPFDQRTETAITPENHPRWFLKVFCKMSDRDIDQLNLVDMQSGLLKRPDEPAFGANVDIGPWIKATNPYDAVTELAVIERYREKYFVPTPVTVNGVTHTVYNSLRQDVNPETGMSFAEEFRSLLKELIVRSLQLAADRIR